MKTLIAWMCLGVASSGFAAQTPDTVFLEELTWTEVRDAIRDDRTTVIFPTGGTEQNGPHMVLGKHSFIVKQRSATSSVRRSNIGSKARPLRMQSRSNRAES